MTIRWTAALAASALLLANATAEAQTRVTYKSAKSGSSYYQMGVEIAEAMKAAGDISVTVEESQGSVQNVMEAAVRGGDYVFTSPPALVDQAREGTGPFEGRPTERFAEVRALFPIPSLTMHIVASADEGVSRLSDLEGKTILLGKGSFGATEGETYLELFGLTDKVTVADAELSNAVAALKNGQIDAFVTAGSFPAPNVIEAAAGSGVSLVTMTDEEVAKTGRARLVIPAGTYPGQEADVVTTSLPVIAYGTTAMDADTAYQLTKTFWEEKARLSETAPWWTGVTADLLDNVSGKIHEGALRYYEEAGMAVPEAAR